MPDEAADNTAPMSQDDIDAMLSGDPSDSGDPPQAGDAGSTGPVTQADVDTAGAGGQARSEGPLSQDDIDAALAEAGEGDALVDDVEGNLNGVDIDAALSDAGIATGVPKVQAGVGASASNTPPPALSGNVVQGGDVQAFDLPDLQAAQAAALANVANIEMLRDVELNVKIELGRSRMLVEDVLKLDSGAVVELDKLAGDPVDVFVNEQLVARGEVLVLNDNFCVRINEIVAPLSEMKTA